MDSCYESVKKEKRGFLLSSITSHMSTRLRNITHFTKKFPNFMCRFDDLLTT